VKPTESRAKNRLAAEASPYLQQHANNPVDWYPWGPEALTRAKIEDKPILLSIGYSACHWCHVMERESFEDEAIASRMNALFVSVKVDREERPDLDQIYQLVVQLMGRNGGWPLTVFLTPEQKPFFGGTYFPPVERHGMPGFPKILEAVADAYRERRGDVELQARELAEAIGRATQAELRGTGGYKLGPDLLLRTSDKLATLYDEQNGGFGKRPKFPNTMGLEVLLRRGALEGDARSSARVYKALEAMRRGGVYDQLGGGFHRYSTDERWLVPHFEKMLYDNALLLGVYANAFRVGGEARWADVVREIAGYVRREMTDPGGAFYATQDADSEGEEGRFFVWDRADVLAALGSEEDIDLVCARFGVTPRGNFEETAKTVLFESSAIADLAIKLGRAPSLVAATLASAAQRMFDAREKRVKPFRDEKILAGWNGLMIGALAVAGGALADEPMVQAAVRAFAFVDRVLVSEGRVQRLVKDGKVKGPGFLDDHAFVASAALDLYEATGDPSYVTKARAIADAMMAHFWDKARGGFYFSPEDSEPLIVRTKDPFDHAIPSGASIAATVLLRLSALVDRRYAEPATVELEGVAAQSVENPFGLGQAICALDRLARGSVDVVLVGGRDDARTRALARVTLAAYLPNRNVAWLDPQDPTSVAACAELAEGKPAASVPVAYVCRSRACSAPIESAEALALELARRED
jgi:uncharacterized protein YyaL (SSP411 family)